MIKNTQGDTIVVYDNPQNKLVDDPPFLDEPDTEGRNVPIQPASFQDSNHPQQASSYIQNGNSSGSNKPLHNFSPNNHLPNHSPAHSSRKNLPHTRVNIDRRRFVNSSPHQNISTTPEASISNKDSFNNKTTNIDKSRRVNNYHIKLSLGRFRDIGLSIAEEDDIREGGTGINTDSEEEHEPSSPSSYFVGVPLLS